LPNGDVTVNGVGASEQWKYQLLLPRALQRRATDDFPPRRYWRRCRRGDGKLQIVFNTTALQTVSASGLDLGLAAGIVSFELPTTFK
jgi:hypothetical protein